ncbi:MAG: hypothetical protein JWQ01_2361 [Massilia sp.]|jgi:hypothetical protein|nr:hypothetical protein [Massilia sp.]
MEFLNRTDFPALHYDSIDQHGELFHVVVVRQSFSLTQSGTELRHPQAPLCETDLNFGEDGGGNVLQESDLSPFKPMCDIIVNAVAHAPQRTPVRAFRVRLVVEENSGVGIDTAPSANNVGNRKANKGNRILVDKSLTVHGGRSILQRALPVRVCAGVIRALSVGFVSIPTWRLTEAKSFTSLPLRYEYAYGGENILRAEPKDRQKMIRAIGSAHCYPESGEGWSSGAPSDTLAAPPIAHSANEHNPVGAGFAKPWYLKHAGRHVLDAPRIEYTDHPFDSRVFWKTVHGSASFHPAGFGAIGRTWLPRRNFIGDIGAGHCLPPDFSNRYWNCAPLDQQCQHLRGDEVFSLINMTDPDAMVSTRDASGDTLLRFQLPSIRPFLALCDMADRVGVLQCVLDTVVIDPESRTLDLVWRSSVPAQAQLASIALQAASPGPACAELDAVLAAAAALSEETSNKLVEA